MPLRGDFKGLDELKARLAHLATPTFRRNMSRVLAQEAYRLIEKGFQAKRDPYGRAWPDLTSRTGMPLQKDGHLLSGLAPKADEHGFTVTSVHPGAAVHQYGAVIRPKNGKALAFNVETGMRVFSKVGGKPLKKPVATTGRVFAQKVTIPARPYMPEGELPPSWQNGLGEAADEALRVGAMHAEGR